MATISKVATDIKVGDKMRFPVSRHPLEVTNISRRLGYVVIEGPDVRHVVPESMKMEVEVEDAEDKG